MSASSGRDAHPSKPADDSHPGRGRVATNATQRVFLTNRRRTSRDSEERKMKKENSTEGVVVPSGSTLKKRKAVLREKTERPDSPLPDRHPPRSTLHQPLGLRSRPNMLSALVKKQNNDSKHMNPPELHRRPHKNSTVSATTDEDRSSRPQVRATFIVPREGRSTSRASTLYERSSKRSSESLSEIENLRLQIVNLKKEAEEARQTTLAKQKAVDELSAELAAQMKLNKKQGTQLEMLMKTGRRNEELVSSVQSNLQCQICWEMFTRPHVLTPCGHVYCMQCLQDWFRSGPALSDDDEYETRRSTIFRKKHCPCCRTRILLRPVELFLVKSLTSAFVSANSQAPAPTASPPPAPSAGTAPTVAAPEASSDGDPWAGLFPVHNIVAGYIEELDENDEDPDGYDSDSQLRSETSSMAFYHSDEDPFYSDPEDSHSASDHEEEEEEEEEVEDELEDPDNDIDDADLLNRRRYVRPPYAPPIYPRSTVLSEYPHVFGETLELLQRGATLLMIHRFDMCFDHQHGISIRLEGSNKLFLGWNIARPDIHSLDGAELVDKLEMELWDRPERWDVVHVGTATFMAWRLVPEDENGVPIPEIVGMHLDDED